MVGGNGSPFVLAFGGTRTEIDGRGRRIKQPAWLKRAETLCSFRLPSRLNGCLTLVATMFPAW